MSKETFHINGGGDISVGILPSNSVVTFDMDFKLDNYHIKQIKDFLSELDDNGATIQTDKELKEQLKAEQDYELEQTIQHIKEQYNELDDDEFFDLIKSFIIKR